ncbi:MAG: hypothetical protein ACREX0_15070 [Noviherbaspirillum sp.]
MQTLTYTIGNWHAEAQLEELETGKLMAVILLSDETGVVRHESKHTIVFDHKQGKDKEKETEILIRRLLRKRYGN